MRNAEKQYQSPFNRKSLFEGTIFLAVFSLTWYLLDLYFLNNPEDIEKGLLSYFISVFLGLSISLLYLVSIQRLVYRLNRLIQFFIALACMAIMIVAFVRLNLEALDWFILKCVTLSFVLGVIHISKN